MTFFDILDKNILNYEEAECYIFARYSYQLHGRDVMTLGFRAVLLAIWDKYVDPNIQNKINITFSTKRVSFYSKNTLISDSDLNDIIEVFKSFGIKLIQTAHQKLKNPDGSINQDDYSFDLEVSKTDALVPKYPLDNIEIGVDTPSDRQLYNIRKKLALKYGVSENVINITIDDRGDVQYDIFVGDASKLTNEELINIASIY